MKEIQRSISPNKHARKDEITAIVIHTTESSSDSPEGDISWLSDPTSHVSAHVVIDAAGNVYRLVPDDFVAYHAGVSVLFGENSCNSFSLGIEIDHRGKDPYPEEQIEATAQWTAEKCVEYRIPLNRVIGHRDVAPERKTDPQNFDWFEFLIRVAGKIEGIIAFSG